MSADSLGRWVRAGWLPEASGAPEDAPVPERPKGNASAATWREYAESIGLDVPEGATKADIKNLVTEHEDVETS